MLLLAGGLSAQRINPQQLSPEVISTETPNTLQEELDEASANSRLYYHAKDYPVNLPLSEAQKSADGYYYRIVANRLGISVYLNIEGFFEGDTLFILNDNGNRVEQLHSGNHHMDQWSSGVYEDEITLFYKNTSRLKPRIAIQSYSLEIPEKKIEDFGDSGPCEVNTNCPEGNDFQNEKSAVVRIKVKQGNLYSWCVGTLIRNTNRDCKPYILTAEHCGLNQGNDFVSAADVDKWAFDFNYESSTCANPANDPFSSTQHRTTGAKVVAHSGDRGGDFGSDFILLRLDIGIDELIDRFNPYYLGWNRAEGGPQSGVCIHHPYGDIKKISTYQSPARSGKYGTVDKDSHWLVEWDATASGHGVTEPGSSGSPLIDSSGLFRGALTGGNASCNTLDGTDYFGKIAYSWISNGNAKNRQLAPWLDPLNGGAAILVEGGFCDDSIVNIGVEAFVLPTLVRTDSKSIFIKGGRTTEELEVRIYDMAGRIMYESPAKFSLLPDERYPIALTNYPQGFYLVQIVANSKPRTTKIVIYD